MNHIKNYKMEVQEQKPKSLFMTEYYSKPGYREKHLEYIAQIENCECGANVTRGNMCRHKSSSKHQKYLVNKYDIKNKTITELRQLLNELEAKGK